jgi:uncharacterized protein YcnI
MKKLRIALVAAVLAAFALAAAAAAHVTVNPSKVPADSFSRFAVRVPNERDKASTVKLTLQLPKGIGEVSFQTKPGWKRTVTRAGGIVTTVTWTSAGAKIAPGEFDEFGVSTHVPKKVGTVLAFPALQTYSNGEIVRWIGPPGSDSPAPRVTLTAAERP